MSLEETNGSSYNQLKGTDQNKNIYPSPGADGQEIQTPETKTEDLAECKNESQQKKSEENSIQNEQMVENKDFQPSEADQKLYDEVLEKLDIKPKEFKQEIQEKSMRENSRHIELSKTQKLETPEIQIKQAIEQDFSKIQQLIKTGLINSVQGQNLKQQVLKKAFDKLVQTEKMKRSASAFIPETSGIKSLNKDEVFEEFSKHNPDFFSSEGRREVLDYLKSGDVIIGKDELDKISSIVRNVEKSAIDRYLQKMTHEKTLRESNESAKQRLSANAQKSSSGANYPKTFNREQIGKMSSAEFAKNESAIMEQLQKGLIK